MTIYGFVIQLSSWYKRFKFGWNCFHKICFLNIFFHVGLTVLANEKLASQCYHKLSLSSTNNQTVRVWVQVMSIVYPKRSDNCRCAVNINDFLTFICAVIFHNSEKPYPLMTLIQNSYQFMSSSSVKQSDLAQYGILSSFFTCTYLKNNDYCHYVYCSSKTRVNWLSLLRCFRWKWKYLYLTWLVGFRDKNRKVSHPRSQGKYKTWG